MADNLRSATASKKLSKDEAVLGDKAIGGMDNDADHVANVAGGLKAAITNPNTSDKAKEEAERKLKVLDGKQVGGIL